MATTVSESSLPHPDRGVWFKLKARGGTVKDNSRPLPRSPGRQVARRALIGAFGTGACSTPVGASNPLEEIDLVEMTLVLFRSREAIIPGSPIHGLVSPGAPPGFHWR